MVEDRVTDGKRIAQLLASELTGLETGPLAEVSVTEADPDVEPSPAGPVAYTIEYRGSRIGSVSIYPDRARLRLEGDVDLPIESGAGVKRGVDTLRAALSRQG